MKYFYSIAAFLAVAFISLSSQAAFTGLSSEIVAVDGVTGMTTYRVYADFDDPNDQLISYYGLDSAPMEVIVGTSLYQNTAFGGATSLAINTLLFPSFPDLEYDSWFALGLDSQTGNNMQFVGFDFSSFEAGGSMIVNDIVGGTIFVLPGEPQALPVGGRVLIGQFTTDGTIDFLMNVQWRDSNNVSFQNEGLTLSLPQANPGCTDPDADNFDPTATEDDGSCTYPAPSFSGLTWETVATGVAGGSFNTYRVYANFSNPLDQLTAVYGQDVTPLEITSTGSFFQQTLLSGPFSTDYNPADIGIDPDVQYDSWVTIGAEDVNNNNLQSLNVDASTFEAGGDLIVNSATGGAWFVFPDDQPAAFPDPSGRVLVAQVTTDGFVDLTLNLQYRAQDGTNPQETNLQLSFPPQIPGCTDPEACNFNPSANEDDGTCIFPDGCTDSAACNFDPAAQCDDGSCILPDGCTDAAACNFDPAATCDDGSCILPDGCTDAAACNFDPAAQCDDGSCILPDGCTDAAACNFDPAAQCDDGSCILPDGCTDAAACNFDPAATCDDGSCILPDGCTDSAACNFDPAAQCDDGSCVLPDGCTDSAACNFDPAALCDDGSCILPDGCTDPGACNFDPAAQCDNGSCEFVSCAGCTNPNADNYDPSATIDDGSCVVGGCTYEAATNFDPAATVDDGSCLFDDSCAGLVFGCTDPAAFNFDPAANTDNGGCIAVQPGCIDPAFSNFNPYANTDDGSCANTCIGDLNNTGEVNSADLLLFLGSFGTVCQ